MAYRPDGTGIINDDINILEYIHEINNRLLRGGTFNYLPVLVRSAFRFWNAPAYPSSHYGFRPSRTYH